MLKHREGNTKECKILAKFVTQMTYLGGDRIKAPAISAVSGIINSRKYPLAAHTPDFDEFLGFYWAPALNSRR